MESKHRLVQRLSAEAEAAFAKSRGKVVEEEGLPSLTVSSACAGSCMSLPEVTKHVCRCLTPKSKSQRKRRNLRCPRRAHRTPHELFSSPSAELFGLAGLSSSFQHFSPPQDVTEPRWPRKQSSQACPKGGRHRIHQQLGAKASCHELEISFQSELR